MQTGEAGTGALFDGIGLSFTARDELVQTPVDVEAPGVRTHVEALEFRIEAHMREVNLGAAVRLTDLERDVRANPLLLVFNEVEVVVQDVPNDLLAGNEFRDFQSANVDVFVAIRPFVVEFVGATFNVR